MTSYQVFEYFFIWTLASASVVLLVRFLFRK